MKNYITSSIHSKLPIKIITLLFSSLFIVSCEMQEKHSLSNLKVDDIIVVNKSIAVPAPGIATSAGIAGSGEDFDILVAALDYYDLEEFVNERDLYTVFAPTDPTFEQCFSLAGVSDLEGLIQAVGEETLLNVPLYHVTDGRRASNSVVPPRNYRTIQTLLANESFEVDVTGNIIDNLNLEREISITNANISASNGSIHVVNAVLIPLENL